MDPPDFLSREEWKAREPRYINEMKEIKYVQVTWTGTDSCRNKEECIKRIQEIQNKHMDEEGEPDIKYNFIVTPDQDVYVGRGWDGATKVASENNSPKYKDYVGKTIVIAYIGKKDSTPSAGVLRAAAGVVTYGLGRELIASNVDLIKPEGDEEEEPPTPGEIKSMVSKMDLRKLGMFNK